MTFLPNSDMDGMIAKLSTLSRLETREYKESTYPSTPTHIWILLNRFAKALRSATFFLTLSSAFQVTSLPSAAGYGV
jgi:hypothetical protein